MTTQKKTNKPVHFGTISIPLAKGLYKQDKFALLMVLLYIDSRKQKRDPGGYEYPFEYNAPDIHRHTGVGLKVINVYLRLLELRGALQVIKNEEGKPSRTSKGALKYRVNKKVYEEAWGPGSRGFQLQTAGLSEPCTESQAEANFLIDAGLSEPALSTLQSEAAGLSGTSLSARQEGLSRPALNALRPGLSAPTNDNERIREEKNDAKKEDTSGSTSPPLLAPGSVPPSSEKAEVTPDKVRDSLSPKKGLGSSQENKSIRASKSHGATLNDPIDPKFGMPRSYVRRYESHAAALDAYLTHHPDLAKQIANGSNQEAATIIMNLLDTLNLH